MTDQRKTVLDDLAQKAVKQIFQRMKAFHRVEQGVLDKEKEPAEDIMGALVQEMDKLMARGLVKALADEAAGLCHKASLISQRWGISYNVMEQDHLQQAAQQAANQPKKEKP